MNGGRILKSLRNYININKKNYFYRLLFILKEILPGYQYLKNT